jgi:hypothetical protein
MIKSFNEHISQAQFEPIKSFYLKSDLCRKVWDKGDNLKTEIRDGLLKIANDYLDYLEIDVTLDDIILTGSLANYNWSDYSDFDLHLVFNFGDVDENTNLVKKFLDASEKVWKFQHDLEMGDFPVELYCQDTNQKHTSTGIYSVMNEEWIKKPKRSEFTPDEELIKIKSKKVMIDIKDLESDLNSDMKSEIILDKLKRVWKRIKDARQAGLEKDGEYSIENLIFKLLRRNGYIQRLMDIKREAYDKQFR